MNSAVNSDKQCMNGDFCPYTVNHVMLLFTHKEKKKKNLKTQNLKTQTPNPNGIIIEQWKMKFVIELSLYDLRTAEEYLGGEDSFT